MLEKVQERAEKEVVPIIEELGYEVVEVKFIRAGKNSSLTFFIHKKGGVDLNDCERVNNALETPLDELDITDGVPYSLNISSPGLDRPIVTDKDYNRNLDIEVEAHFFEHVDKKKKIKGILTGFDAESVTLKANGKLINLSRKNIKLLQQYINFK